jgi:hypothetical protein
LGKTVEKYFKNTKERNHKEQHSIPAFIGRNWVGLLKNTFKTKHKERNKQHITQSPAFIGRNWVGLLKILLRPKHKERNHKESSTSLNPLLS